MYREPLAYFITFRTYGTWLHGDDRGSVSRINNHFGTPLIPPDSTRVQEDARYLAVEPLILTHTQRECVDRTVRQVIAHREWHLHAINVRTNHVHAIVGATCRPEHVMNSLKSWCTRELRKARLIAEGVPVWARHGSTVYLFTERALAEKIDYVINQQ